MVDFLRSKILDINDNDVAGGPGLERGMEGEPAEFNVWTREAGPGSLAISVEGPSKAHIDFKDRKDGSCYVSYIVEVIKQHMRVQKEKIIVPSSVKGIYDLYN